MQGKPFVFYAWHWRSNTLHVVDGFRYNECGIVDSIVIGSFAVPLHDYTYFIACLN